MTGITENTTQHRYEQAFGAEIVFVNFRREGDVVHLLHVEAPPALRGTGAAGQFMTALMAHLRDAGLKATPVCSYAVSWLRRHPEYQDLVAN